MKECKRMHGFALTNSKRDRSLKEPVGVIIPAIKKNVAFPDDLIKKLDGISLIQRCINTAKKFAGDGAITVITDSEEISLICERSRVECHYDADLKMVSKNLIDDLRWIINDFEYRYHNALILRAYTPLLGFATIEKAYHKFLESNSDMLISAKRIKYRFLAQGNADLMALLFEDNHNEVFSEVRSFIFFKTELVNADNKEKKIDVFELDSNIVEIQSYQDWWICEKLLFRKRIVFRVIGNTGVGMGHIFRALALAHEITDHEIIFVCDKQDFLVVTNIAGSDYLVMSFDSNELEEQLISMKPDLVINDMLDTSERYIRSLKNNGIRSVNFEDTGTGACLADLTFNELFDEPFLDGKNILWGKEYYFIRDEFTDAMAVDFKNRVERVLIAFGGTDQHNLSLKVLNKIVPFCRENSIHISIVTGPGYPFKNDLERAIKDCGYDDIDFTYATGVISKIMEKTDIAVTSNGRTLYELCHMNIPGIVISQHDRERTHLFSCPDNGFVNIGRYQTESSGDKVLDVLKRITGDLGFRKKLYDNMVVHDFSKNKRKVVKLIERVLNGKRTKKTV